MESDEQLHHLASAGDRDAFGRIVERYQSLVCSVAYGACGDFAASEDLAQETFLAAWRRMGELQDPARMRGWLCGIVRNLAANSARRTSRRGGAPRSMEGLEEPLSLEHDPASRAVASEEESLVWQSLEGLPEIYREPLVLFYREHQSVAEVARQLELSEDSVRQRLSRGRSALREEVMAVVESALTRTRPGRRFTLGVLAAVSVLAGPQTGATASAAALTVQGAATGGKGGLGKLMAGAFWGPATGVFVSWLSARALQSTARSPEERRLLGRHAWMASLGAFGMCALLVLVLTQAGHLYPVRRTWLVLGVLVWVGALVALLNAIGLRMQRKLASLRTAYPRGEPPAPGTR